MKYVYYIVAALVALALPLAAGAYFDPSVGAAVLMAEGAAAADLEQVKKLLGELKETGKQMGDFLEKGRAELNRVNAIEAKTSDELGKLGKQVVETETKVKEIVEKAEKGLSARLTDVEQKLIKRPNMEGEQAKSAGEIFVADEGIQRLMKQNPKGFSSHSVPVGAYPYSKAALITSGANEVSGTIGVLAPATRVPGLVTPANRLLTIRNLLRVSRTGSNLVEYAAENVFTNSAAPQGAGSSPAATEAEPKAQSGITFNLTQRAVITLAHWIAASRQVLSDAPMLQSYIDGRLRYGLALEEEDQILNGAGTGGDINGLINQATAYNKTGSNDTKIDTILKAMLQTVESEYVADGFVISNFDWFQLLLIKDTQGRYIFGDPSAAVQSPRLWGLPGVATNSIATTKFLVGNFMLGAELWDREDASVRVSDQHMDFFTRNLVAILAEERLALCVYRPTALIYGTFPV